MARNKKYNGSGNPRGPGVDQNGRSKDKGVWLPFWLIDTPAFFAMSPTAQALLMRIGAVAYGSNNGRWFMSVRDAAALLGVADRTAATALQELIDHGFLVVVQEASFELKTAAMAKTRARVWRATWLPVRNYRNQRGSAPTSEFKNWRATTPMQFKRIERGREVIDRWRSAKQIADADSADVPTIHDNCNPMTNANIAEVKPLNATIVRKTTSAKYATHSVVTRGRDSGCFRATVSQCIRARDVSLAWLSAGHGRTQKQLSLSAGIDPAKFSRFLADRSGRKTLTEAQALALFCATDAPEINHQPKKIGGHVTAKKGTIMTFEETEKLELGRTWLAHIDYDPEWSYDELKAALAQHNPSADALAAIVFALRHHGEALIAEGDALIAEGEALQAQTHTPEQHHAAAM